MARKPTDEKTDYAGPPPAAPPPAYPYPSYPPPNSFPNEKRQQDPMMAATGPSMVPPAAGQPRRLHILGATWGGVVVTPQIAAMVSANNEVLITMPDLQHILQPDPAYGTWKSLAVLYQFDGQEGPTLINIGEDHPTAAFCINGNLHETSLARGGVLPNAPFAAVEQLPMPWRPRNTFVAAQSPPAVEILAATWGPKRVTTPVVLEELGEFFEGRRGQIRMTNAFFKDDPARGMRKSWAVFFRFGPQGRVQVVTGWEGGALEVPWSRWI